MVDLILERFWDKVKVQSNGCWNFRSMIRNGYGRFKICNKTVSAHRFAYEVNKGKIPKELTLDHLCRNRACVNPDHLEILSLNENQSRGNSLPILNSKKTHCPKGHELKGDNLIKCKLKKLGWRECRICWNEKRRKKIA